MVGGPDAWYMDDDVTSDKRLPHKRTPDEPCSAEALNALGVYYWKLDGTESDPQLEKIRKERGYSYSDCITCSRDKLPDFDNKLVMFYQEHIHSDEEIRYCMDGSGYFDVRDLQDRWIRVKVTKGDLIVLPAGIYHRFTLDTNNHIQAMRLFVGEPVWTPYNRPQDEHPARQVEQLRLRPITVGPLGKSSAWSIDDGSPAMDATEPILFVRISTEQRLPQTAVPTVCVENHVVSRWLWAH